MRASFEIWSLGQLREKNRCRVEGSISCIPLRTDPICRCCYETDMEPAIQTIHDAEDADDNS